MTVFEKSEHSWSEPSLGRAMAYGSIMAGNNVAGRSTRQETNGNGRRTNSYCENLGGFRIGVGGVVYCWCPSISLRRKQEKD